MEYLSFLQTCSGRDVWLALDDSQLDISSDWTWHRTGSGKKILDRMAASDSGVSMDIKSLQTVSGSDHRPIMGTLVFDGFSGFPEMVSKGCPRRLRLPTKGDQKRWNEALRLGVSSRPELLVLTNDGAVIQSDEDMTVAYESFALLLYETGGNIFGIRGSGQQSKRKTLIGSPELQRLRRVARQWNRLVHAGRSGYLASLLSKPDVKKWSRSLLRSIGFAGLPFSLFFSALDLAKADSAKKDAWTAVNKLAAHEESERIRRRDQGLIAKAVYGGSTKKLFSSWTPPVEPYAVSTSEGLTSDPEKVMKECRDNYAHRFRKDDAPLPQEKPWLNTKSVLRIAELCAKSPFVWPVLFTIATLRRALTKRSKRPSPGPDMMEKWAVAMLDDDLLQIFVHVLNYAMAHEFFTPFNRNFLLPMFKGKGLFTDIINFRPVTFGCLGTVVIAGWFVDFAQAYAHKMGMIPSSQVSLQPQVQMRDLTSLLDQLRAYCIRHKVNVYSLVRDQQKGFDLFDWRGVRDALIAFGWPQGVITFAEARLRQNSFEVKTPYGLAEPFILDGQLRQGDPPNPFFFCLAMALGTFWIEDTFATDPLILTSMQAKVGLSHVPSDSLSFKLTILSAMDDTRIFASSMAGLRELTLMCETFQEVYGARTDWSGKSWVTILGPGANWPQSISLPTTKGEQSVAVRDEFSFLKTQIGDYHSRFLAIRLIVETAAIPGTLSRDLPLTAVKVWLRQNVFGKIRGLIALCPLLVDDAKTIDSMVARLVASHLGLPFKNVPGALLNLQVKLYGFGFPSVFRINGGLAFDGILRDLNHRLDVFNSMAQVSLCDLRCGLNGCQDPLLRPQKLLATNKRSRVPSAWFVALQYLEFSGVEILSTDQSFISRGHVALEHLANMSGASPTVHGAIKALAKDRNRNQLGIRFLRDLVRIDQRGRWHWLPVGAPWVRDRLVELFPSQTLERFCDGPSSFLTARDARQDDLHAFILAQFQAVALQWGDAAVSDLWASDGSRADDHWSLNRVSGGVSNGTVGFSFALTPDRTVAEAEIAGIYLAVLAAARFGGSPTVISDHLNAVRLVDNNVAGASSLRPSAPFRSSYGLLLDLLQKFPLPVEHVKAHTGADDVRSRVNDLADSLADRGHNWAEVMIPFPEAYLPAYAARLRGAWWEGNLASRMETELGTLRNGMRLLPPATASHVRELNLFLPGGPAAHPYERALSTTAARVQFLLRCDQLPTGARMSERLADADPSCPRCGDVLETEVHVFRICSLSWNMRDRLGLELFEKTFKYLDGLTLSADSVDAITTFAQGVVKGWGWWRGMPLLTRPSEYWSLPERNRIVLEHIWHQVLVVGAARIWGGRTRAWRARESQSLGITEVGFS